MDGEAHANPGRDATQRLRERAADDYDQDNPRDGLESDRTIKHARSFWMITAGLVVVGVALISGGVVAGLGPVAFVCGALLLWSGVVKAIVLRIWHTTLNSASAPDAVQRDRDSATVIGQRT